MRALLLPALGLALSACSPDTGGPGIGDPCTLDDPCEEGVCNLSGAGAATCVDSEGDVDNDGLANKSDFCNQQPGGQYDEDGDGRGDDCDACPIARPPAKADTDADAVDSPCDPEPTLDGNRITVFDGFNGALPATWNKEGTWEVRGGEAIYTSANPATQAYLTAPLALSSRHLAMFASYRINRVEAGASQNFAGVTSMDDRPAGTGPVTCAGQRVGSTDALLADSSVGAASMPFQNLFDPAALYRIVQLIDNATGSCAMQAADKEGAAQTPTPGEAPTSAGLTAGAVDARFQYILIVQRPN